MWYLGSYSSLFPILCFYCPVCYMSVGFGNTEYDLVVFLPEALQTRQSPEDTACQPGRDLSTDLHTRLLRWRFLWETQKHLLGNVLISSSSITHFCLIVFSCTDLIHRPAFRCASITSKVWCWNSMPVTTWWVWIQTLNMFRFYFYHTMIL